MRQGTTLIILTAILLTLIYSMAFAVPPSDEIIQKLKDEGRYQEYLATMADARSRGVEAPTINKDGKARAPFAASSSLRTLVILIDFPDKPYTGGLVAATQEDFQNLLFSEGVIPTGSMREYYIKNSFNQFYMEGDVVGWYRASHNSSYYTNECDGSHGMGPYPYNAQGLVEEAIGLADPDVDFSQYDNDGDGWVDGIFVIHAGTGYEETGNNCEIHSHKWSISAIEKDSVFVSTYTIEPEESPNSGGMIPIGVFCHEFGHVLGLPDLYDTDYSSKGVGKWALMAGGSYNNQSRTPASFTAWSKYQLGWLDPILVSDNMTDVEIPPAALGPVAYRLWTNGQVGQEYFLVENKQEYEYDAYLPSDGLLIWHVDDGVNGNNNDWHPQLFLEQADGRFDLQHNSNNGDAGDTYEAPTEFTDETTPDSKAYSYYSTQVAVWNISPSDSIMTANFDVHWSRPNISLVSYDFSDTAYGDGDGIFEEGETIQLVLQLGNKWKDAETVQVTVSEDDPLITMTQSTSLLGDIPDGTSADNSSMPIEFELDTGHIARIDSFFVEITSNAGTYTQTFAIQQNMGTINILIVDDDNNDTLESYYTETFYDKLKPFDRWDRFNAGSPSLDDLKRYGTVIWFTGDYQDNPLMTADISALKSYLDLGGCLFLSGQGIAAQLSTLDADFLNNYLKTNYLSTQIVPILLTNPNGQVLNGLDTLVIQSYGGASNQTKTDHLAPVNGGVTEATYLGGTDPAAISYSGDYKTVFFGFGFEGLGQDENRFARRDSVLSRILTFFGDGGAVYIIGDANGDGVTNVGDAAYTVNYIFKGGPAPIPTESAETNGDCRVNVGDVTYLINYIFKSGPAPINGCK